MNKTSTYISFCIFFLALCFSQSGIAQTIRDSAGTKLVSTGIAVDKTLDSINKTTSPRKAAIRSALIPGWGQVYVRRDMKGSFVKKYWKLPVIYGALGTSAGVFFYNVNWYKRTRFAYTTLRNKDSANFKNIHPQLQFLVTRNDLSYLQQQRNSFRRDVDYSVLFFIALWGLNVIDATVDAHLKGFDISPDLSLRIQPGFSELAGTKGISLVLVFK